MIEKVPWQTRFWGRVDQGDPSGCWLWTGKLDAYGYGYLRIGGRKGYNGKSHRLVYELLVGPIPEGLQIDHLCRVRHCVNPAHLEPVTSRENTRRGEKSTQTTCQRGHLFDEANTIQRTNGRRTCRTCANRSRLKIDREFRCGRCGLPLFWVVRNGGFCHAVNHKNRDQYCGQAPDVVAGDLIDVRRSS